MVPALDRLHDLAAQALQATPAERDAMSGWQESLKTTARRWKRRRGTGIALPKRWPGGVVRCGP